MGPALLQPGGHQPEATAGGSVGLFSKAIFKKFKVFKALFLFKVSGFKTF